MVQSVAAKYGETKAINPRFVNHIYPFNVKKLGWPKQTRKRCNKEKVKRCNVRMKMLKISRKYFILIKGFFSVINIIF